MISVRKSLWQRPTVNNFLFDFVHKAIEFAHGWKPDNSVFAKAKVKQNRCLKFEVNKEI